MKKTAPDGADRQTHRQTHGHGNSMTESPQWGRFSEKQQHMFAKFKSIIYGKGDYQMDDEEKSGRGEEKEED